MNEKYMGILFTILRMVVLVCVRNILVRGLQFGLGCLGVRNILVRGLEFGLGLGCFG